MTLKDFEAFVNSILEAAQLNEWKAVVEDRDGNYKSVASCDPENKTIFVSYMLRNRPDYEIRASVEREIAHAKNPKKYHKRNGLLIEPSSKGRLVLRKLKLVTLFTKS